MDTQIPFAVPDLGIAESTAVVDVMKSGWLTTGSHARAFEAEFAEAVGARYAVALNSCTAALHLAIEALGVTAGDEVIVPTMTFAASAEVVRYLGATPVLVDVDPATHCMLPAAFEQAITERTRAVIPVHFAGRAADMDAIMRVAREHSLVVVEDAAHAFPARLGERKIGSIGDVTCFSFYATKTITTGEGGMLVTDSAEVADRARMMSLHGLSRDAWNRYSSKGNWYYEIVAPGYKYNMSDLAAAIGRTQLRRAEEMRSRRQQIADMYATAFGDDARLELLESGPAEAHAWHLFVLKLRNGGPGDEKRSALIRELAEDGIGTSVHFIPLHLHPYYRSEFQYSPRDFPAALDVYQRSISLPIYSALTNAQVHRVIDSVRRKLDLLTDG